METYYEIDDSGKVRCAWCGRIAKASACYYIELTGGRKDIIVHKSCVPDARLHTMMMGNDVKRRTPAAVWRTRRTVLKLVKGGKQ